MIALITFIISGSLIAVLLVGQAFRLRFTDFKHHGHEAHPVSDLLHEVRIFFLGINRESVIIFARVLYRLFLMLAAYFMDLAARLSKSFLTSVRANDVRKEKGAVSAYLKRVSHDAELLSGKIGKR